MAHVPFTGNFKAFFILAITITLGYGFTLNYPFHFDDLRFISDKPVSQHFRYATREASTPHPDYAKIHFHLKQVIASLADSFPNRNLTQLTFAVNYAMGGTNNRISYHLVNIFIHWINACLVFYLIRKLAWNRSWNQAFFGSLVFACHPLQTSAVTYILQRNGLLGSTFYLLTVLSWIQLLEVTPSERKRWMGLGLFSWFLALQCKEIVVTAPLICWAYYCIFKFPVTGFLRIFLQRSILFFSFLQEQCYWHPCILAFGIPFRLL